MRKPLLLTFLSPLEEGAIPEPMHGMQDVLTRSDRKADADIPWRGMFFSTASHSGLKMDVSLIGTFPIDAQLDAVSNQIFGLRLLSLMAQRIET